MKIDSNRHRYAIRCNPKFGDDIQIANNANTTRGTLVGSRAQSLSFYKICSR